MPLLRDTLVLGGASSLVCGIALASNTPLTSEVVKYVNDSEVCILVAPHARLSLDSYLYSSVLRLVNAVVTEGNTHPSQLKL
eukprot:3014412-Pyramimonas_sp.AAC.1